MDIIYLGHSGFKFKGKDAIVVVDPLDKKKIGFGMSPTPTDVVVVSHDFDATSALAQVSGTPRRAEPYIVNAPGEYEVNGVGIFGWGSDANTNTTYSIIVDGVRITHLGSLHQVITDDLVAGLGTVDVLLIPVGGGDFSIGPKDAQIVIEKLSPSIVIPMLYRLPEHAETFAGMLELNDFLKVMGISELAPLDRLKVTRDSLPEGMQVVVLAKS